MSRAATTTRDRALSLLSCGVAPEQVAAAIGVTPSAISQLVSDPTFASELATAKYENLRKHNERDSKLDKLEDTILEKLDSSLSMCYKPMELLKALQVVNGAKRRGQSAPEQVVNQQNIVQVILPTQIIQKFTTNIQNQVVRAGSQELETIQSGSLSRLYKEELSKKAESVQLLESSAETVEVPNGNEQNGSIRSAESS